MLDNVTSERDTLLRDLRAAGGGGGPTAGVGEGSHGEVERLRQECDQLRYQVGSTTACVETLLKIPVR